MTFLFDRDPSALSTRAFLSDLESEVNRRDFTLSIYQTYRDSAKHNDILDKVRYERIARFIDIFIDVVKRDIKDHKEAYTGHRYFDMRATVPIVAPIATTVQDMLYDRVSKKAADEMMASYDILIVSTEPFRPDGQPCEVVDGCPSPSAPMIRADLYSLNGMIRRYMQKGRIG